MGLWFLRGKTEPKVDTLSTEGSFPGGLLGSQLMGITGDQTEMEKDARLADQQSDLGRPHSCLQCPPSREPSQKLCPYTEPS